MLLGEYNVYRANFTGAYVNTDVEVLFFSTIQINIIKWDCK